MFHDWHEFPVFVNSTLFPRAQTEVVEYMPKRSFNRSINAIFGKNGRLASEEVIIELTKRKCIPV